MKVSDITLQLIEANRDYFLANRCSGDGSCPDEPKIFVNTKDGLELVSKVTYMKNIGVIIEL